MKNNKIWACWPVPMRLRSSQKAGYGDDFPGEANLVGRKKKAVIIWGFAEMGVPQNGWFI